MGVGGIFGLSRRRRGPICPFSVAANVRVISSHVWLTKTLTALALAVAQSKSCRGALTATRLVPLHDGWAASG